MLPINQVINIEINLYGLFFSFDCECVQEKCQYDFFI